MESQDKPKKNVPKLNFLHPDDKRLPMAYNPELKGTSSEVSTSITLDDGYTYLVPSFKYGKPLRNPEAEFRKTGDILGGPFKTVEDAEKFAEIRHKYVEKGQKIPSNIKTSNINRVSEALDISKYILNQNKGKSIPLK